MRRPEKELTDPADLADVLERGRVLHLGMVDDGEPYVVPVDYGFDGEALYVHSAEAGRKIGVLVRDPRVCFEVTVDDEVRRSNDICNWSSTFRSVIGWGRVELLADPAEKAAGLTHLIRHYGEAEAVITPEKTGGVAVLRIRVERMTGKVSKG